MILLLISSCNSLEKSTPDLAFKVYLIAYEGVQADGEKIGCSDTLVSVDLIVPIIGTTVETALSSLLVYPNKNRFNNPLLYSNIKFQSITMEGTHALVKLNGKLNIKGVCDHPKILAQLERTVLQFNKIESVEFVVDEKDLKALLSLKS